MKCQGPKTGKREKRKEDTGGTVLGGTRASVKWESASIKTGLQQCRLPAPTATITQKRPHITQQMYWIQWQRETPLQGTLGPRDRAACGLAGGLRANT